MSTSGERQSENHRRIFNLLEEAFITRGNDLNKSVKITEEALDLSEKDHYSDLIARSLSQLSLFHMIKGNFSRSLEYSDRAIQYYEAIGDEKGIADVKFSIAGVHYKSDNYHLGLINLIESLEIYKKFKDFANIARCHKSLGTIYEYFGDQKQAIFAYQEAISYAKLAGDANLESNAYNPLSGILIKKGELERAMEMAELAMQMKLKSGDRRGYAFSVYGRAKVLSAYKRFHEAERDYKEALSIHIEFNEILGTAMTYCKLGQLYLMSHNYDQALEALIKARDFSYKNQVIIIRYKSNYWLYKLYKELNHSQKALNYLEDYLKEKERVINTQSLTIIENYELLNKVESMHKEAQMQKERAEMLEKKNKAENLANIKQDFLSTMSHEIRTPLNAIITIANLLDNKTENEDAQLIKSLKFASNNLLLLINDILDFTKLESGKVNLEPVETNLGKLLEEIRFTYASMAEEKGLQLNLLTDPVINSSYLLDSIRFSQILANLIGNAIKYTDQGKILVEARILDRKAGKDIIRVSVEDTGIGIPSTLHQEIFNSFSQTQEVRTRKQGGSGLGLAIVKKLVELFGSTINLISHEMKGSVFYFDLTLEIIEPKQLLPVPDETVLYGKTVLLVEDNQINAMVATKLLAKWQIETTHALNGLIGIEKASRKKYNFILMDIHMPEMDGFEATKWIRSNPNPNIETPVIALTADITAESNTEYAMYFNYFLRKPIENQKLFEILCNPVKSTH